MLKKPFIIIAAFIWFFSLPLWSGDADPLMPGPKDRCPVCGMFVAKYPDFIAIISFNDGTRVFFDGVKDMMKYYLNLRKYAPSKKAENIASIYVTDYYTMNLVDGVKAVYVTGSDVYGPMGRELIPFEKQGKAEEFIKDHDGKDVFKFFEITPEIVKGLDARQ